jgi:transcriptional regulator with XRE-family HTH domain|nr:MAG TPA: Cro/C1-type HTH DNA-binding domain protein [Caudoviricetes sp.]
MSILYERLFALCQERGITAYRMCKDTGVQPSVMTDLKMGRRQTVKAETAAKIAAYFGVSVDYLLGNEEKEKPTAVKAVSDEELKFALFGDATVSDEDFEDVKRFAEFIKNKKKE